MNRKAKTSLLITVFLLFFLFVSVLKFGFVDAISEQVIASVTNQSTGLSVKAVYPYSGALVSAMGECFTAASNFLIRKCSFMSAIVAGSPNGAVVCKITGIAGTFGTNAYPNSTVYAVSDFVLSSTFGGIAWYNFTFSGNNSVNLVAGNYFVMLYAYNQTIDTSNYFRIYGGTSNAYAGNEAYYVSGGWTTLVNDCNFYVYGDTQPAIQGASSNENGVSCVFSSYWVGLDLNLSGYVFSYDISGSYANDTWTAFASSNNSWANVTKVLNGSTLGATVHYLTFANASDGSWWVSSTGSFVLQASVTFFFVDSGFLYRNWTAIANQTATTYTTPTNLILAALPSSQYAFLNFTVTNSLAYSTNNPLTWTVTNKTDVWLYMLNATAPSGPTYNDGYVEGLNEGVAIAVIVGIVVFAVALLLLREQ